MNRGLRCGCFGVFEADRLVEGYLLRGRRGANAVGRCQGVERAPGPGVFGRQHHGIDGEVLGRTQGFLIAPANGLTAVVPVMIEVVVPSMPRGTPKVALKAVESIEDSRTSIRLMDALALPVSTKTTRSSLLSAGILRHVG